MTSDGVGCSIDILNKQIAVSEGGLTFGRPGVYLVDLVGATTTPEKPMTKGSRVVPDWGHGVRTVSDGVARYLIPDCVSTRRECQLRLVERPMSHPCSTVEEKTLTVYFENIIKGPQRYRLTVCERPYFVVFTQEGVRPPTFRF